MLQAVVDDRFHPFHGAMYLTVADAFQFHFLGICDLAIARVFRYYVAPSWGESQDDERCASWKFMACEPGC